MKIKLLFFFFCVQSVFSQSVLSGKVVSDNGNPDGILIANYSSKQSTTTSNGGLFTIEAKPNDIIVVSSTQTEGLEIRLNSNSFLQNPLIIKVKSKINQLEEIEVRNISTKSLGIVDKNVKEYTPAQRKLRTAGKFKWFSPLLIPFGGMSVDGLINKISGRTSMLKKELQVENKERLLEKFDSMYEEAFFVETLKIPSEYIKGFQIYALDDAKFVSALKSRNKTLATFLLAEIVVKYKSVTFPDRNTNFTK